MATITIRDLPDDVRDKLRVRAAKRGVSMESEVRLILAAAVASGQVAAPSITPALLQDWISANRRATDDAEGDPTASFLIARRRNAILETIADGLDPVTAFGPNLDKILKEARWSRTDLRKAIAAKK